jgi:LmbE family N-acetylglucosaminyl deacetylase
MSKTTSPHVILLPPTLEQKTSDTEKLLSFLEDRKDIVVVSPHLDDAVLSMGSLLAYLVEKQKNISVITVFTQGSSLTSGFTQELIRKGGCLTAKDYFIARKTEDIRALKSLGIEQSKQLDFIDAAWRMQGHNEGLYTDTVIGIKRHEKDIVLLEKCRNVLQRYISPNSFVFAPLGVGKHVDHVLVRDVCASTFPETIFYTDFPYSLKHTDDEAFQKAQNLKPVIWQEDFYEQKKQAIAYYETQLESLCQGRPLQLIHETFFVPESVK